MQDAGEWQVPVCDRLHSGPRYDTGLMRRSASNVAVVMKPESFLTLSR